MGIFDRRKPKKAESAPYNPTIEVDGKKYYVVDTFDIEVTYLKEPERFMIIENPETGKRHTYHDGIMSDGFDTIEHLNAGANFKGKNDSQKECYFIRGTRNGGRAARIDAWEDDHLYAIHQSSVLTEADSGEGLTRKPITVFYPRNVEGAKTHSSGIVYDPFVMGKLVGYRKEKNGFMTYVAPDGAEFTETKDRSSAYVSNDATIYADVADELYADLQKKKYRKRENPYTDQELFAVLEDALKKIPAECFGVDEFVENIMNLVSEQFQERISLVQTEDVKEIEKYLNSIRDVSISKRQEFVNAKAAERKSEEFRRDMKDLASRTFEEAQKEMIDMEIPKTLTEESFEEIERIQAEIKASRERQNGEGE